MCVCDSKGDGLNKPDNETRNSSSLGDKGFSNTWWVWFAVLPIDLWSQGHNLGDAARSGDLSSTHLWKGNKTQSNTQWQRHSCHTVSKTPETHWQTLDTQWQRHSCHTVSETPETQWQCHNWHSARVAGNRHILTNDNSLNTYLVNNWNLSALVLMKSGDLLLVTDVM